MVWVPVAGLLLLLLLGGCPRVSLGATGPENALNGDEIAIRVNPRATVIGETVCLGDIAEITAAPEIRQRLAFISLGRSPRPGQDKPFSRSWIAARLNAQAKLPAGARVSVPERVTVQRAAQRVASDVLERFFNDYLARRLPGKTFRVSRFKVRGDDAFPMGKLLLRPAERRSRELAGRVNLPLEVMVDGRPCGRLIISAWVSSIREVVCLKRPVSRGTVLTAEDLCLASRDLSRLTGQPIFEVTAAEGMQLRRSLRAGECLKQGFVEAPPMISKGDRIKMVAASGRLRVWTMGIARSDGGRGEQIKVENPVSGKTVVGEVVDPSTVAILF